MPTEMNFMDVSNPTPPGDVPHAERMERLAAARKGLTELGHQIDKCRGENSGKGLMGIKFYLEPTINENVPTLKAWARPFPAKPFPTEEEQELPEHGIKILFMPTHIGLFRIKKYMETESQPYEPASFYRTLRERADRAEKPDKHVKEAVMEFLGKYAYSESGISNMTRTAGSVIREKCLPHDFAPIFKEYLNKIQNTGSERILEPDIN